LSIQVSVSSTGALERQVNVEVPEDRISGQVDARLGELTKSARIDGFRPGKVPRKVLERRFGARVRQEVIGEVLQASFREALQQEALTPAGEPTIDPLEAEPGHGLRYTATFEVYPQVELTGLEGLSVEKPVCQITDADVDAMLGKLREQRKEWREVERPAAEGDRLTVDFTGYVDGEPFEGGSLEDAEVEIGAGQLIAGFEEGLVGAAAGEHRRLELAFPEQFGNAELAGKPVTFEVQVKKVQEPVLPDLDEAFAEAFGVAEGGVEQLRAEVRANMERERAPPARARHKENLMNAVVEAVSLTVPQALVREEALRMAADMRRRLAMQGLPDEQLGNLDPEMFTEQAEQRVKRGLILAEAVRVNGLRADPAAVRQRIEALAASYEEPAAVVNWYYEDRQRLSEVESTVLEDAACDWIMERASVTEQLVSFDALMNSGQTG